MSELIRALDVSAYSGPTSAQWWRDRYAEGWRLATPGSWHGNSTNPYVRDQMGFAQDAGMMLATYIALSSLHSGDEQVAEARYACGDFWHWNTLEFVALDMELPGLRPQHLTDALVEIGLGLMPVCYTGYWWWEPWIKAQHNAYVVPHAWSNLPAWVAYYDGYPKLRCSVDTALPALTGLGPIIGKQYAGSVMLDGTCVDLNVFGASFLKEEAMDWPKAKLELFNHFLDWFDLFPESEAEKRDAIRQEKENNAYREFYDKQIAWRSPPR